MNNKISKPDANPVLFAALNLFLFGAVGYFVMGQQKKAITTLLIYLIGGTLTCGLLYMIAWVTAYDAYLLGQKLQAGDEIGMNENGLPLLNSIFKD